MANSSGFQRRDGGAMRTVVGYRTDQRVAAPADEPQAEHGDPAIEASLAQVRRDQALEASFARARRDQVDAPPAEVRGQLEAPRTEAGGAEAEARPDEAPEASRVPARVWLDPLSVAVWSSALALLALVIVAAHALACFILR
jgi:hypothetical protein